MPKVSQHICGAVFGILLILAGAAFPIWWGFEGVSMGMAGLKDIPVGLVAVLTIILGAVASLILRNAGDS